MIEAGPAAGAGPAATPVNRMGMAVLSLGGLLVSAYLLLFKLGIIATVVCGTGDCDVVQTSKWSDFLGLPVPLWGVVGYSLILGAALRGTRPGRSADRALAGFLFGASAGAFLFSIYLSVLEEFVIGAWCRWCIGSALIATLLLVFSIPELRRVRAR